MTSHDQFRALLKSAEGPIAPDPLFDRRLRHQFLSEANLPLATPGPVIELDAIRRNRMLDLAAVAILLLSMVGGLIGIRSSTIGLPTPTAQAADITSPTATATVISVATMEE